MAHLYADENFNLAVVQLLRSRGHDVLTVQEAGENGSSDRQVLAYATAHQRAVLTFNRRHFIKLHKQSANHAGVVACTDDAAIAVADRIHDALAACPVLDGQLIRITRPP